MRDAKVHSRCAGIVNSKAILLMAAFKWLGNMRSHYCRFTWRQVLLPVLTGLLFACGGGGGGNSDIPPVASGLVVGQGQNQVSITVRSNSEIVLNGENSDGVTFPIRSAVWTQTDSTGIVVQLDKRTDLSRAVRIPDVAAPTTLTFELELTNTDGDRNLTEVTVNVIPVGDGDRFLEFYRQVPGQYSVVAALQSGTVATSDVTFRVVQQQVVDYPNRTTAPDSDTANEFDLSINGGVIKSSVWPAGTTATWQTLEEAVNAFYHPNICFALPKIDIDDINVQFDDTDPDRGIADHHRDEVNHKANLRLEVTSGTCEDAGGNPVDCQDAAMLLVLRTNGSVATETVNATNADKTIRVSDLSVNSDPALQQPESAETARAYYDSVDPFDRRLTFGNWLQNAGFLDTNGDLIPDDQFERALYINNYDLGFTRDMFVRKDESSGDIFAYVINYPALRKAVLKNDAIATVAMEFGPPDQDPSGERIVKFFVFGPDGEGNMQRVKSLNFDGRGEKWVPGACVPCHGGELKNLQPDGSYPANGNIHAAFIPWDIDSLLFVQANDPALVDPLVVEGFKVNPGYISAEDLQQFSLENQQATFRRMNELVLETMVEDPLQSERFDLVREQIHGWYGNFDDTTFDSNTLPANDYDGLGYIQDGWAAAGLEDVYHEVYSRHCRICHSQALEINQFVDFNALTTVLPDVQRFVYEDGVMPNARLDMDRFWVDFRGAPVSAAERFADALGIDPAIAENLGRPIARISGAKIQSVLPRSILVGTIDSIVEIPNVVNEDGVRLDGSISAFADSYSWQFTEMPTGSSAQLIGDTTAKPAFAVDVPGRYVVELSVNNDRGPASTASVIIDATPTGPKLAANATLSVTLPEAIPSTPSSVDITTNQLQWVDADSLPANLTYTVTSAPIRGSLSLTSFTQADIDAGLLTYSQDADNDGPTDGFTYTIADETGNSVSGQDFAINITALNDEPVQRLFVDLGVSEGATQSLSGTLLWTDVDGIPTFSLTTAPGNGELQRGGVPVLPGGITFTQSDIDSNLVNYVHDGDNELPTDSLAYSVSDGGVVIGPVTLNINIANVNDVPQLQTQNISLEAAREERLSGGLSASVIPAATLAVLDSDTTDPADVVLELESAPTRGDLVVRSGATDTTLGANDTFTLAQVITASTDDGLFYVSTIASNSTDPITGDSFALSVSDGQAGDCINTNPSTAACTVSVALSERTDGPSGTVNAVGITSFMDAATARNLSTRTSTNVNDMPWADVLIDDSILDFADNVVTGEIGECALKYVVADVPNGNVGFLKRGDAPLTSNSDSDIIGVNDEFTHAEVIAGNIYYENRAIGGGSHSFDLQVTDCLVAIDETLTIDRALSVNVDVGFVMDTIWEDATDNYVTTTFNCPPVTEDRRACRQCHAGTQSVATPNSNCAVRAGVLVYTVLDTPGGALNCANLAAQYTATTLPDEPTQATHFGDVIFPAGSIPDQILQTWNGVCP